ncbi:copper resistance protein B [Methylocucumis oryzae]|uniref:copper resistance protein B n=1 Tax=Methylocucumis oryzae TaxID=1632867 RepID=UPI001EF9E54F|nr:copper resistance protein B [Methylocucumis oryzae]
MMKLGLAFFCLAAAKVSAEPMMAHDMSHHHEHNHTLPSTSSRNPHAYSDGYDFSDDIEHSHKEEALMGAVLVDRLEAAGTGQQSLMTYDWQAWYGKTF